MLDPVHILGHHLKRISPAVCKMPRIKQQAYIFRIRVLHHALHLIRVLYHGSHMMMEGKGNPVLLLRNLAKTVHAVAEGLPLFVVHHIFMPEDRRILLSLHTVALLRSADDLRSHGL